MKKINKDISIKLSFGIFSAIGFVAGILLIIFGAGKSAIMLTAGIILGINGFYGTPLWFISYGENKAIKRVVYAIEKEKIYSVKDIATQLQLPEKDVKEKVNKAIEKNYISGLLFDGKTFKANNCESAKTVAEHLMKKTKKFTENIEKQLMKLKNKKKSIKKKQNN